MKLKKWTQGDATNVLGIARTTYQSYEQSRRSPDVDIQNKIADYFDVSLDDLYGREGTEDQVLSDKQLRIWMMIRARNGLKSLFIILNSK
ncbi:hypothetical protein NRIC_21430 [Enterococcus florum]|uniref:HTH cro/C1-type domain-containing protein n=1 Tax=Enterococcus florum TaxID=2480627 RepID=A0A4P5PF00_9ENTE|nr:helix-turn-helix transcriptional regulator [Enterococcus florum]GCF94252.1 hypothetical protein NRIC_21430 [Enterococcus florum]